MKRTALIVGINNYAENPLTAPENDAREMERVLKNHANGSRNFDCELLISGVNRVHQDRLKEKMLVHFKLDVEICLFFFAGHGISNDLGTYLLTQDGGYYDEGVSMYELFHLAQNSPAKEVILILDCCMSGDIAAYIANERAIMRPGLTIISSAGKDGKAVESGGNGVFTSRLIDALEGGAADAMGRVSMASVYNYVDKILSIREQRPVFKTHIKEMITVRRAKPRIDLDILKELPDLFPSKDYNFPLDKSYERTEEEHKEAHVKIFSKLQKLNRESLIKPHPQEDMYFAAVEEGSCHLTPLGKYYWEMALKELIY